MQESEKKSNINGKLDEIKNNGKEEYLAPVYVLGQKFDIKTEINLANFFINLCVKESTIEVNQEESCFNS